MVLRGSASIYFNPFLSHGQFRRGSVSSLERVLIALAIGDSPRSPRSVTSKRTATSRKSQICEAFPEEKEDEAEISDNDMTNGEPSVNNKHVTNEEDKTIREPTQDVSDQNRLTGVKPDNTSEKSVETRKTPTMKLGQFIVKYGIQQDLFSPVDFKCMYMYLDSAVLTHKKHANSFHILNFRF